MSFRHKSRRTDADYNGDENRWVVMICKGTLYIKSYLKYIGAVRFLSHQSSPYSREIKNTGAG